MLVLYTANYKSITMKTSEYITYPTARRDFAFGNILSREQWPLGNKHPAMGLFAVCCGWWYTQRESNTINWHYLLHIFSTGVGGNNHLSNSLESLHRIVVLSLAIDRTWSTEFGKIARSSQESGSAWQKTQKWNLATEKTKDKYCQPHHIPIPAALGVWVSFSNGTISWDGTQVLGEGGGIAPKLGGLEPFY